MVECWDWDDGMMATSAYLDRENVVLVGVCGSHEDERLSSEV
jgi:hypothetical protein